jgi:hypothetical protein
MNETRPPDDPGRAGYRLGADDAREADEFESLAAATLGAAAPPVTPRPELKDELMSRIDALSRPDDDAASARHLASVPSTAPAAPAPPTPAAATPGPAERKAAARWRRPAVIIASVAAAFALFAGGLAVGTAVQPSSTTSASALTQVVAAPDAQHLAASFGSDKGSVAVVASAELGRSVIVMKNAPAPPSGKTYEAWYLRDGAAIPAGTVDPSGTVTTMTLDGTYSAGDGIALTVEPAGGSKQPTTKPVFAVQT